MIQSAIEDKERAKKEAKKAKKKQEEEILKKTACIEEYKLMDYHSRYQFWCGNTKNKEIQAELAALENNDKEIRERFENDLTFGTAGLRGIMGAGTSRMNIYTVARVTEGLANYIKENIKDNLFGISKVVISYDTRNNSKLFADTARTVLESYNIQTYMFSEPHPVPLLSFAVRHLKADFGIMITASHNPKEYNGYKLYNRYGGQLTDEASTEIAKYIDKVPFFNEYKSAKKYSPIDLEIQQGYYSDIIGYFGGLIGVFCGRYIPDNIDIVYTSIHGSGLEHVKTLLDHSEVQFKVVEKQANYDGNFPTVKSPNPENKEALALAVEEAEKCGAAAVIATDPDADRMAAAVRNKDGEFYYLDGNQTGILLFDYILSEVYDSKKSATQKIVIFKSFVSTNMIDKIAAKYGAKTEEVGVGFKNIAEKIRESEEKGEQKFSYGFEESCGYLLHPYCRDKDGVSAALVFARMVQDFKSENINLLDRLEELYREHGYFVDKSVSAYYEGLDGFKTMQNIMNRLFDSVPAALGGKKITASRDYKKAHNSVYYELEGGSFVCVRPSGTEPKLKYYIGATAVTKEEAQKLFHDIQKDMECLTKQ